MADRTRSWLGTYKPVSRRRFLTAAAAGAGAAALIACSGGDSGDGVQLQSADSARQPGKVWRSPDNWKLADETDQAVSGGIYRGFAASAQDEAFDPMTASGGSAYRAHLYEQLMQRTARPGVDPASKEGLDAIPGLAEAWEFSNDGLTVTFTLRPNVKFHNISPVNGRVMDMDDWRLSHERNAQLGSFRGFSNSVISKVEYPDSRHMVWKLTGPYAPMAELLPQYTWGWAIMPKELSNNPDLAKQVAIGTGFKQLDVFQPSITHEYKKVKEYWGGEPFIDRWHFPVIPEYANRYAQFLTGATTTFDPTSRDVLTLAKDAPGAVIIANPPEQDRASRYLFGIQRPANDPYNDPRVRIALRRSVDWKSIGIFQSNKANFEAAGFNIDLLPMTHLPQNPAYWLNPEKGELGQLSQNYLYDPAAAKALMSAAGHSQPLPLKIAVEVGEAGTLPELQSLITDSLKTTGTFALDILQVRTAEEQRRYRVQREWDGIAWTGGSTVEPDYLMQRDWSTTYLTSGITAFPNPKTEDLFNAQRRATDFDQRVEVLKDIQRWAAEWMMVIPAQHIFGTFRFQWPWIHNANWGDPSTQGTPYWGSHKQWLDANMPKRNG